MFEARLTQGSVLKLIVDAMKDLVSDANFECTGSEISVQVLYEVVGNGVGDGLFPCDSDHVGVA